METKILTQRQLRLYRLRSQRLLRPAPLDRQESPAQVLSQVAGVQAQDPVAAGLALHARASGLREAEISAAQAGAFSAARTWCMRGTLQLMAAADLEWMLPLLGPRFIALSARRYAELGLSQEIRERAAEVIQIYLETGGGHPVGRDRLVEHLRGAGLPTGGQAGYHLIRYAGLKGVLRYGPNENRLAGYLPANLPAGPLSPADEEAAYFRLARRYLQAYSPAGPEDLAVWAGIPLTTARKAFDGISKQLRLITFDGMEALVLQEGGSTPDHDGTGAPIVNLIPAFDPYLLGYKDREPALPARYARRIHPGGGVLRPALLLNGQAAGTWNLKRSAGRAQLSIIPFETLGAAVLEQIQLAATAIGHFYSVEIAVEVAAAES